MSQTTTTASPANFVPNLIVSTVDSAPYVTREMTKDGEKYSGFIVELLDHISRRAGFTYEFQQAPEGKIGALRAQGWTGIMGELIKGNADIGATSITVTAQREEYVDFSKPFMTNSVNLLVQKPSWSDLGLGYLVRPFSSDYWIMLLVVLLLIGIVFFVIGKFSPYEWGNVAADKDPRGAKNSFTLRNSYLFMLSTVTWQGFREAPHSISGRIMAAFWWMFVLFSLIAYTSNLTAFFLARPEQMPDMPFQTYEELLEHPDIKVLAYGFGSTQHQLRNSRKTSLKEMWSKINSADSWVEDYDEGVAMLKSNPNYVMLMETASSEYYARQNCNLMMYGENLFPTSMAFALQKGSMWKKKIDNAMREMREEGLIMELRNKYWKFAGDCSNVDGRQFVRTGAGLSSLPIYPVTLKDMAVAILLLFLGFLAAMVFLVVEIVHYAVTKKGKKIEKPKILKNPPKIFRPKSSKPAKPAADAEAAGPSSDGLESVPLSDPEEPGTSDELHVEEEDKVAV